MTVGSLASVLLLVEGRVQGVGFRPFVWRLARDHHLAGWVRNEGARVLIRLEGAEDAIDAFSGKLIERAPAFARPRLVTRKRLDWAALAGFSIDTSAQGEMAMASIPPDYPACPACLMELRDPSDRRYRYPFINCTQCGPRYTIIDVLPYDRPNTAMAAFSMCAACQSEYERPDDRRYHAQPLACTDCGPRLQFVVPGDPKMSPGQSTGEQALRAVIAHLRQGRVVAVKGIGGFHLFCDARSEAAVRHLRRRKQRPDKPLAVMVRERGADGLAEARAIARLTDEEAVALLDPVRPVVIAAKRPQALASSIAPGLREIGLLLPYSPLHALLLDGFGGPVVATSGNRSGDPVEIDESAAVERLKDVADAFLIHNRPIRRPADDPVCRRIAGHVRPLRLGRGNAPLQLHLPVALDRPLLAVGGQKKNTVALAWANRAVVSPHIGDLGSLRTQSLFVDTVLDLQTLFGVQPQAIVCDQHPDYSSTRWARRSGLPLIAVQHHRAHASALAGEHKQSSGMLVFTWDGVGKGDDDTLWGGEAFLGGPGHWRRVASLRPFRLPGGERAAREPWRCALGLCWEAGLDSDDVAVETRLLRRAWESNINCPVTTSVGRLFDAVAAMLGFAGRATYEAQAAIWLETEANLGDATRIALQTPASLTIADWEPLIGIVADASRSVGERSAIFHEWLAETIRDQAVLIRRTTPICKVGLVGGVFQNKRLTERAAHLLTEADFEVLLPSAVPMNDAGLSYGQIIEAAALLAAQSVGANGQ
ncbi:MAG: carbamoyltransferase HypF [Reyranella sp.]|uniref:Carbamoyltransferase HypF n=1 Tax=Enhydrobacter aerosaccus TaxID=225324 RepID=A0A1T4SJC3_9HYPH|nr:carbamoyltransferase HypF [Enhydrobacter aerosaccus]KAF0102072.1 MAG: hydrogenase maturation protein HypF [Rhodospirillaceae bacterium]TBR27587.1 MAG: carbamoyltransferase HypF [Reyranella sp.]SKA28265.1 Hydrogenase maturation protein, carbamoyltransferase HypF [Enhydrobacter aerosaccus]